jgi:hypothetical protein
MSYLARGSMQRGGGAPCLHGDLTAESIVWAAIPVRRNAGRIPAYNAGPLLRGIRRPVLTGIDGKAIAAGRRRSACRRVHILEEAAA